MQALSGCSVMARTCDAMLCSSENESMHKWLTFCVDTLKLKADSKRKELERLRV